MNEIRTPDAIVTLILQIVEVVAWLGFTAYAVPRLAQGAWAAMAALAGIVGAVPTAFAAVENIQLRFFDSARLILLTIDHSSVSLLLTALSTAAIVLALLSLVLRTNRALRPDLAPDPRDPPPTA